MFNDRPKPPTTAAPPEVGIRPSTAPPAPALDDNRSLARRVLVLSIWPMLEQMMSFLVGFTDTALAGHLGGSDAIDATNAVGTAGFIIWLMGLLQGAVGVGATALIARAIGAHHKREAHAALGQSIAFAALWGLFAGVFFYLTAPIWAPLSGLSGRSALWCTDYLRLLAVATPFMAVLFVGGACLRGAGHFRSAFFVMLGVNAVNIGVSILLVIGPEPIGGHGLSGIALGTLLGWIVGCGLMLRVLLSGRAGLRLHPHRLRLHRPMLRRILRVGLPNLAESTLFWAGNFLVLAIVGRLNIEAAVGAHMIAVRIEAFSFLPGFALSLAAATLTGQALGAGRPDLARRSAWVCTGFGLLIMCTLGVMFMTIPEHLVRLVTDEPVFLRHTPPLLKVVGWAQAGFGVSMILSGALRGAGDTRTVLLIIGFVTYGVRVPLVAWVGLSEGGTLRAVWMVLGAELCLRGLLFAARFLHGGWARIKI